MRRLNGSELSSQTRTSRSPWGNGKAGLVRDEKEVSKIRPTRWWDAGCLFQIYVGMGQGGLIRLRTKSSSSSSTHTNSENHQKRLMELLLPVAARRWSLSRESWNQPPPPSPHRPVAPHRERLEGESPLSRPAYAETRLREPGEGEKAWWSTGPRFHDNKRGTALDDHT